MIFDSCRLYISFTSTLLIYLSNFMKIHVWQFFLAEKSAIVKYFEEWLGAVPFTLNISPNLVFICIIEVYAIPGLYSEIASKILSMHMCGWNPLCPSHGRVENRPNFPSTITTPLE